MSKPLPNNDDLVERGVWSMDLGLRIKILTLSIIEANSKDMTQIARTFLNVIVLMAKQYRAPMRVTVANISRDAADEIERCPQQIMS